MKEKSEKRKENKEEKKENIAEFFKINTFQYYDDFIYLKNELPEYLDSLNIKELSRLLEISIEEVVELLDTNETEKV